MEAIAVVELVPELALTPLPNLTEIEALDAELKSHFAPVLRVERQLSRQLVSFQANKAAPFYRWFKYKEGYSVSLVEYLLDIGNIREGRLLDPFAGAGTTLFASRDRGLDCDGIELLPIGRKIINTRLCLSSLNLQSIESLREWCDSARWSEVQPIDAIKVLRITRGAYPDESEISMRRFISAVHQEKPELQELLTFAMLSILEDISFTRKDGQYLRWDSRSSRLSGGKTFDKGKILTFDTAVTNKIRQMLDDLTDPSPQQPLFGTPSSGHISLIAGSCLDVLPTLEAETYSGIITSPPYCNRYDYTRTYALELAALGVDEVALSALRQTMLSCTVENRPKTLAGSNPLWNKAVKVSDTQALLQSILYFLDSERDAGRLNNGGIARMVRGYFYEMACVIAESHRVLKKGARLFMVNDNVRYAGASISVDLILSKIAEDLGFIIENILVLPLGKGNSSQQMGHHGREQLRKCVYVWRKA